MWSVKILSNISSGVFFGDKKEVELLYIRLSSSQDLACYFGFLLVFNAFQHFNLSCAGCLPYCSELCEAGPDSRPLTCLFYFTGEERRVKWATCGLRVGRLAVSTGGPTSASMPLNIPERAGQT